MAALGDEWIRNATTFTIMLSFGYSNGVSDSIQSYLCGGIYLLFIPNKLLGVKLFKYLCFEKVWYFNKGNEKNEKETTTRITLY